MFMILVATHFLQFLCSWFSPPLPSHFFAIVSIISIVLLESQKVKFVDRLTTLGRCSPGVIGTLPLVHPHLLI